MYSDEQNFGEQHPSTAMRYDYLAWLLIDLNEKEKAIELWKKAYSIMQKVLGEEHPHTQIVKKALEKYKPKS